MRGSSTRAGCFIVHSRSGSIPHSLRVTNGGGVVDMRSVFPHNASLRVTKSAIGCGLKGSVSTPTLKTASPFFQPWCRLQGAVLSIYVAFSRTTPCSFLRPIQNAAEASFCDRGAFRSVSSFQTKNRNANCVSAMFFGGDWGRFFKKRPPNVPPNVPLNVLSYPFAPLAPPKPPPMAKTLVSKE